MRSPSLSRLSPPLGAVSILEVWLGPGIKYSNSLLTCKFAGDLLSAETESVHLLHGPLSICSFVVFDEGVSHLEREVSDLAEALKLILEVVLVHSACEFANVDRTAD